MGEIVHKLIHFPFCFLLMPFAFQCSSLPKFIPPSAHFESVLLVEETPRRFIYYVPSLKKEIKNYSLTLVLHGGGGNSEGMVYLTRFSDQAEAEGTIFVYPQGIGFRWNDGRNIAHSETDQKKTDDILFLKSLVKWFQTNYPINPSKIHVVGLSNGGFMAQKLACENSDTFATFVSVAATLSLNVSKSCSRPDSKIAINLIFGKEDQIVPYKGGTVLLPGKDSREKIPAGEVLSYEETSRFWLKKLGCLEPKQSFLPNLKGTNLQTVERKEATKCELGSVFQTNLILKGEHIWPHGFYYKSETEYGYLSKDFDASSEILKFQRENPKTDQKIAHRFTQTP